jgi:hypothetical protein
MRTARTTLHIAAVLALPYLVIGLLSDGPYAGRLLGGAVVLLLSRSAARTTSCAIEASEAEVAHRV